jgi:hypothetical protein
MMNAGTSSEEDLWFGNQGLTESGRVGIGDVDGAFLTFTRLCNYAKTTASERVCREPGGHGVKKETTYGISPEGLSRRPSVAVEKPQAEGNPGADESPAELLHAILASRRPLDPAVPHPLSRPQLVLQ